MNLKSTDFEQYLQSIQMLLQDAKKNLLQNNPKLATKQIQKARYLLEIFQSDIHSI